MNINRDNYEMMFLLYVDNELSAEDRKAVEAFAELNPDLGIELSILKETVLPADDISFKNKADLFKSSEQDLLQEKLLLHLDNELAANEKVQLEQELLSNQALNKEFQLLQRTRLDASEVIEFKDKKSLYRTERTRVITMRFARLAIAAVFLGAGLFFGFKLLNQGESSVIDPIATNSSNKNLNEPIAFNQVTSPVDQPAQKETSVTDLPTELNKNLDKANNDKLIVAQTAKKEERTNVSTQHAKADQNQVLAANKVEPRNNPSIPENSRLLAMKNPGKPDEKLSPERTNEEVEIAKINRVARPSITDVNLATIDNSMARTAGITDLEEADDDKILYVDEDKVTRTKAAGFLRKLKRTVERNTRIKTGNGVRIAGFEFAVK